MPLGIIATGDVKPSARISVYSVSLVACSKSAVDRTRRCNGHRICFDLRERLNAQDDSVPRGEVTSFA